VATSTLHVCVTCRSEATAPDAERPGARLLAAVERRHASERAGVTVIGVACLSNCQRGCSAAVTGADKWTFVIGGLDPDLHAGEILQFARQHHAHDQGLPIWRERPDYIRKNTIARVPPLPLHSHKEQT
jgi:predicted metal-binding protein